MYGISISREGKIMNNPFNVTFGELPNSLVSREEEIKLIKDSFDLESPETKVYVISGLKGCGKTVLLTYLSKTFKDEGYITIDLNPFEDLNEQFAAKLYKQGDEQALTED